MAQHRTRHRVTRRALHGAVAGGAVVAAFTAGVVVAGPEPVVDGEQRLDEAAGRIEREALGAVDREDLDAAAIAAMLDEAGDPWGQWQPPTTPAVARSRVAAQGVEVRELPGGVTHLVVPSFERGTGRQVRQAVQALPADAAGVVLDLRGNGGGLLDEAVETASAFLDGGPVVRFTRRDGAVQQLDALGAGDVRTSLVVLVDSGSASASEVVAGALRDRGRAVLVGGRTFGKGTVQEPSTLTDGSRLQLTVGRYATPSGASPDGVGLEPDVAVADPEAALERAVAVLPGLLAGVTP